MLIRDPVSPYSSPGLPALSNNQRTAMNREPENRNEVTREKERIAKQGLGRWLSRGQEHLLDKHGD